jgi:hypothetical protein
MVGKMTETEREELIEKMVQDIGVACGYWWSPRRKNIARTHAIIALEVAEPVIREQTESALREENARLREALEPLATAYEEFLRANDCTEYEIANDPYLFATRAAIREGCIEG